MKQMVVWLKLGTLLLALFLGGWFALENSALVPVTLFGQAWPEARLGVWLLAFTGGGLAVGVMLGSWSTWRLTQRLRARERQLAFCEKELDKLRSRPLRD